MGHVTEEDRYKLCPAGKPVGLLFSPVFCNQMLEFGPRKMMKQLTKQGPYLYDGVCPPEDCIGVLLRIEILQRNA
jgi:hypothetical protein